MDVLSLLSRNMDGIYRVMIQPVERALPEVGRHFDFLLNGFTDRIEIYKYSLGFLRAEEEYMQMQIMASYHECQRELEIFTRCCTNYYCEVIPSEFLNTECFSLLDVAEINPGLLLLSFTCDVPKEYAESVHGINFRLLDQCFQSQGS